MADVQISDLAAAAVASLTDQLAIDNVSNVSKKVTIAQLRTLLQEAMVAIKQLDRTATAVDYTTVVGDYYIGVTNTDAARAITLGTAQVSDGNIVTIKDESGGAGVNYITVATEGSEKIDGQDTFVMNASYNSITVVSDGTNWFIK